MSLPRPFPSDKERPPDRGAAAVEFVLVLPLLMTLIFGVIEFGWAYTQDLDVRHGAREGARLLSVNAFPAGEDATTTTADEQTDYLVEQICSRMDFSGNASISLTLEDSTALSAGATAIVTVRADLDTVTGWFDPILGGKQLESTVEVRLEQQAQWSETTDQDCP